jgi:hypothetical protein
VNIHSNARSDNAGRNPDEEWAKIKKSDGTESTWWPANRQTLWGYDGSLFSILYIHLNSLIQDTFAESQLTNLLQDFELQEGGDMRVCMNGFMTYIGECKSHTFRRNLRSHLTAAERTYHAGAPRNYLLA